MSAQWTDDGERIAKFLARAGIASRRDIEAMIAEARVSVNGTVLTTPAFKVTAKDDIRVDGKRVGAIEPTRLWLYHKPSGLVTTHRDPQGRPTVFKALPPDLPRVISVGRLDLTSEGLLLLTNDGALARRLELPANGWRRIYRARAHGRVSEQELDALAEGITLDGVEYGPIVAHLERQQGANAWVHITIHEGKNREVRKVLEGIGLKVNRLIRVAYGPFTLGELAPRALEEVPPRVLRGLFGPANKSGKPPAKTTPKSASQRPKPPKPAGGRRPARKAKAE